MPDYDEKRGFSRMAADCKMSFRLAGDETLSNGVCINLSGSGILFQAEEPLALGKAAEVRLLPEHRITPPLAAFIEVVRCERGPNGHYRIAGAIKGIKGE